MFFKLLLNPQKSTYYQKGQFHSVRSQGTLSNISLFNYSAVAMTNRSTILVFWKIVCRHSGIPSNSRSENEIICRSPKAERERDREREAVADRNTTEIAEWLFPLEDFGVELNVANSWQFRMTENRFASSSNAVVDSPHNFTPLKVSAYPLLHCCMFAYLLHILL